MIYVRFGGYLKFNRKFIINYHFSSTITDLNPSKMPTILQKLIIFEKVKYRKINKFSKHVNKGTSKCLWQENLSQLTPKMLPAFYCSIWNCKTVFLRVRSLSHCYCFQRRDIAILWSKKGRVGLPSTQGGIFIIQTQLVKSIKNKITNCTNLFWSHCLLNRINFQQTLESCVRF